MPSPLHEALSEIGCWLLALAAITAALAVYAGMWP